MKHTPFSPSETGRQTGRLQKTNPATGEPLGDYPIATPEEVLDGVQRSRELATAWGRTSLRLRARVLKQVADKLYRQADAMAELISRETGKSTKDALEGDLVVAIGILNYYADAGPKVLKNKRLQGDWMSLLSGRTHYERHYPKGVVGIISPWNFPVAIAASGLAATLMAGNTVILKPSEWTPECGIQLARLFQETLSELDQPSDIVQVLTGDGRTGAALVESDIDHVVFTGSSKTGYLVWEAMARHGGTASLELGGSDAMVVLPNADLDAATSFAVWGRCLNAGQACSAVKRLYVPQADYEKALTLLRTKFLRVAERSGPLINERQRQALDSQVQEACRRGARLEAGGAQAKGAGYYYQPTLLSQVPAEAKILGEETFGPVLPVVPYQTVDEAVAMANNSRYGLTASVFGEVSAAMAVANRLEAGSVVINDAGPGNYALPGISWSGWKQSGPGVSHGERALLEASRSKIVSVNRLFGIPLFRKAPWLFSQDTDDKALSHALLAFAHRPGWLGFLNPKLWVALWKSRSSTRL